MKKEYVMGNGAIALGALAAGVGVVAGYPGTPSSEIIETIQKFNREGKVHLEWSVNEKAALEVAAGASYAGVRTLVTMKQMGLNVAADPLMSVSYVGVKGGMVVVSADDPGPISSQTEQDTRFFAEFARIPVFDPVSPKDAYEMIQEAFEYSEKYHTPVLFRPTTRVCHAYESIQVPESFEPKEYEGFIKDSKKWVIFPRLSYANHQKMELRNRELSDVFSEYKKNFYTGKGKKAIVASGISYSYTKEYLQDREDVVFVRIGTAHPFPEKLLLEALDGVEEVLVVEELSPYIENQITRIVGKHHLNINVYGKNTDNFALAGEYNTDIIAAVVDKFLGEQNENDKLDLSDMPALPMRPPVLCAGCPHRGSFYAVKKAMKGRKANFCGDIGCYTLGNAMPLDMVDTCLCMGAGVTQAQGLYWTDKETVNFAFIGDSTFFFFFFTGVANAIYNDANLILCVLDNSTTAMTGHQPHPGTGRNMMGEFVEKMNIGDILQGMGVKKILHVNPLDFDASVNAIKECADMSGVKAILFESPCIALYKPTKKMTISEKCINCKKCINEIGCPAIIKVNGQVTIDESLCTGCNLCSQICPTGAMKNVELGGTN